MSGGRRKRIKPGAKRRAREARHWYQSSDDLAMYSAGVDQNGWDKLPDYLKNLHRLRAQETMNDFFREGKSK